MQRLNMSVDTANAEQQGHAGALDGLGAVERRVRGRGLVGLEDAQVCTVAAQQSQAG